MQFNQIPFLMSCCSGCVEGIRYLIILAVFCMKQYENLKHATYFSYKPNNKHI